MSLAAAAATVHLLGPKRIFSALGRLAAFRVPRSGFRVPRFAFRVARRPRLRLMKGSSDEPVILGPPPLPDLSGPPRPSAERATRNAEPGARNAERATRHAERGTRSAEHEPPWHRPEISILGRATEGGSFSPAELKARARIIEDTLESFNIQARVVEVQQGPAITQFGLDPAPGVAVNARTTWRCGLAPRRCGCWPRCQVDPWSASRYPTRRWRRSSWAT